MNDEEGDGIVQFLPDVRWVGESIDGLTSWRETYRGRCCKQPNDQVTQVLGSTQTPRSELQPLAGKSTIQSFLTTLWLVHWFLFKKSSSSAACQFYDFPILICLCLSVRVCSFACSFPIISLSHRLISLGPPEYGSAIALLFERASYEDWAPQLRIRGLSFGRKK